jgi:hypothetical protein
MRAICSLAVGLAAVSFVLTGLAGAEPVSPPADDQIAGPGAGPWRRLFLDSMVVEQTQGLRRVFHAVEKHPANPVVRKDSDCEGIGPYLYGTVMWDQGRLRMWYHSQSGGYRNHYAESTDGIRWTKPSLGLIAFRGSQNNNLFLDAASKDELEAPELYQGGGRCHNPSVIRCDGQPDPAKRYALFCYGQDYRRPRVAFSPDGLHWTFVAQTAREGLFASSDVINFFYDPYKSRYTATYKTGNRRGRAAGVAVSPDGLKWTKPVEGPVFVADDLDPDATQIYGMPVFPYQGLYIGQPWIYNARWFKTGTYTDQRMYAAERDSPCTMDVQLAWSWDLVNWTRPPERPCFIPRGVAGEFDSGMIYTARAPVQVGDRLYFYYGGFNGPHNAKLNQLSAAIGLGVLRLDGFCSMRADSEEGRLISRREPLRVPKVTINARTAPHGYVVAELLDQDNQVIPGFSRDDCQPFTGDSIRHVVTWKTRTLPAALLDTDKKFRFVLKNADLYSYLPDPTIGPVRLTVIYDPSRAGPVLPDDPKLPVDQRFRATGKPSGYRLVEEDGQRFLDLHSVAAAKTNAGYMRDVNWEDGERWCVEAWYRVVDQGTEPNYGLATFVRPDRGRQAALYLGAKEVGILTADGIGHKLLKRAPLNTTDRFHGYRMTCSGGPDGQVTVEVDGRERLRLPWRELGARPGAGGANIGFGPNAAHREGRLQVAKFGFRIGSLDRIFGPTEIAREPSP